MSDIKEKCQKILSKEEILSVIKNHLKTSDFNLNDYVIKPASDKPLGFLGEHTKIKATVTTNDKTKELNYFVKRIPQDEVGLDYARKTRAFEKEIEAFKTLFKDFDKSQDPQTRTKWKPDFYFSKDHEIFVVEDLSADGYYMIPGERLMDENHVKASLKALAAMHASTIILEEKLKREGIKLDDCYKHIRFETEINDQPGHPGGVYFTAGTKSEAILVDYLPNFTAEEKEKIKKELPGRLSRLFRLAEPSKKYKNVFTHGDIWSNNLLFRKDETGRIQAVIIDFQQVRYGPPALDIMMVLHTVQNRKFRDEKLKDLLKIYYVAFTEELRKNNLVPESLYSFEELVDSCNYYTEFGLVISILIFQYILAPTDLLNSDYQEIFFETMFKDRSQLVKDCFLKDENYRIRMSEALIELIEKYILN